MSYESTTIDNNLIQDGERQELTDHIKKRRRMVLVLVASMFAVTTIIMVMSVVHVEINKHKGVVGYQASSVLSRYVKGVKHKQD